MIDGLREARLDVQRRLAPEMDWFTPPDERHFDPASAVAAVAGLLVSAFLAGFAAEAEKSLREAGRAAYRRLEALIRDALRGEPAPAAAELERLAEKAPALAGRMEPDRVRSFLEEAEATLRIHLEVSLPPDRAASLAAGIREAVVERVLRAGRGAGTQTVNP